MPHPIQFVSSPTPLAIVPTHLLYMLPGLTVINAAEISTLNIPQKLRFMPLSKTSGLLEDTSSCLQLGGL